MDRAKVFVVEDEGVVALDIKRRLQKLGYQVVGSVASGEEAVEAAAGLNPDLILMDIQLKGHMNGLQASELIRSRFDVPVVFVTANSDDKIIQQMKLTEPYGFVVKPFQEGELRAAIEIAIFKHASDRRLKESEQWLAATLQSIGDAVIATDPAGRVKYVNRVAETLTGWAQEQALGQDIADVFRIVDEHSKAPVEVPVMEAMAKIKTVSLKTGVELVARDGRRVPVDDSAAPIIGAQGEVIGAILVFRDITERRRAEERLEQYARELEARNEDLDSFGHTLAHDLKSVLSLVMTPAELLEICWEALTPEERQQYLHVIRQSGHKINAIIDEILLLTQVRKQEVERAAITDMAAVVDRAIARLAYMIRDSEAEIVRPEAWPVALGYGPWVEEVWINYISNAINYGGKPPRVELGATSQPDGRIRFWVRDNGAGITPEVQATVFAPLVRMVQVRATGHGLGLSIVKRIAEKLGAEVGVDSRPGEGSIFSIVLPLPEPPHSASQAWSRLIDELRANSTSAEAQEAGS